MGKELTLDDLLYTLGGKQYQWMDGYRTSQCPQDIMFTDSEYRLIREVFNNLYECFERRYGEGN